MYKTDLVKAVAKETEWSEDTVSYALNTILAQIAEIVKSGEKLCLTGFGTFDVRTISERGGINLQGERITLPESKHVHFKPGKDLEIKADGAKKSSAKKSASKSSGKKK
ncbi:MAG: HU family DNA-binding protein [Butyrivibrio sp.]|nr:HU family DNA-binding protein [Butyrivibrio sp.]